MPVMTGAEKAGYDSHVAAAAPHSGHATTARTITAGSGLTGGGDLTADRTLAVDHATAAPPALGTAAVGTATKSAREDHVHVMPRLDQVSNPTAARTMNNQDLTGVRIATANGEIDDGNSGTSKTIDWTTGPAHKLTLTGDCTLTFTAPPGVAWLQLRVIQDSTPRTLTFTGGGLTVKWAGNAAPTLTAASGSIDFISFYYPGTGSTYFAMPALNFGT